MNTVKQDGKPRGKDRKPRQPKTTRYYAGECSTHGIFILVANCEWVGCPSCHFEHKDQTETLLHWEQKTRETAQELWDTGCVKFRHFLRFTPKQILADPQTTSETSQA